MEVEFRKQKEESFFDRISQESSESENLKMPLALPYRWNSMNREKKHANGIKLIECKGEDIDVQKSARRNIKTPNKVTKTSYNHTKESRMLTPCIRVSSKMGWQKASKSFAWSPIPSKGEIWLPRNLNDSPQTRHKPNRTSMILKWVIL